MTKVILVALSAIILLIHSAEAIKIGGTANTTPPPPPVALLVNSGNALLIAAGNKFLVQP